MTLSTSSRHRVAFIALLSAAFMGIVDGFIVNVAAPSIQVDLKASFGDIQLVIAGYMMAYAVTLTTGGRLGDIFGQRVIFMTGMLIFIASSVGCAIAPGPIALIVTRIIQGVGAALMLPQVLALIQVIFPAGERPRVLGYYAATVGLGSITGQLLGGLLIAADFAGIGWRAVFLVNVPIGLIVIILASSTIKSRRSSDVPKLDILGVILLASTLMLLLYPLIQAPAGSWSWYMFISLGGFFLAGAFFLLVEHRSSREGRAPLLPLHLFKQRGMAVGLPIAIVFYSGNTGLFVLLAYVLQDGYRLSPLESGLMFVPLPLGFVLASTLSRKFSAIIGARLLTAGSVVMIFSLAAGWVAVSGQMSNMRISICLAILFFAGLGQGMVSPPLMGAVLKEVRLSDAGVASGVFLTVAQIANGLGVAIIGALFNALLNGHRIIGNSAIVAYSHALAGCLLALLALSCVVFVLLRVLNRTEGAVEGAQDHIMDNQASMASTD
ncbi:MFS transporter [Sphaerisporangium sp. NPDC051017]|uniref:MFS transporter n=1 Tax=Sphaerisporangium sp. NPDC051017 TaxID=3154636 RepID=UPI0034326AC1